MNGQHKGAEAQLLGQFETTFRTQPGSPAALRLPFVSCGLSRDLRRTDDPSIDNSPLMAKSGCGDAIVPPASIAATFDARTVGFWLKLLLGQPLVKKAVTTQPVNVTGVTIHYAGSACPAGLGTLAFLISGTTVTWTPQGGAAGAAVNIVAGGRFTIQGGAANQEIVIDVVAGAIPAGNASDTTINVHSTLKAHVFPVTLDDRPTALLDLGHMKTAANEIYRYLGSFITTMQHSITGREQNMTMTVAAAEERSADTTPAVTAVWDAAATSYDRARFCGSGGTISNGRNSDFGVITEGDMNIDIGATGLEVADGLEGFGHLDNGEIGFSGRLKLVFRGLASGNLWTLARSSTSSRVRVESKVTVGADVFRLFYDFPSVEFMPGAKEVSGKTGLFVDVNWKAHRTAAGTLPMIVLVNDVPSY